MFKKLFSLSILTIFLFGVLSAQGGVVPPPKKPDLVIDQLYVKILQKIPNEGMKVRIVFVVKNISPYPTSSSLTPEGKKMCPTGCFMVRLNVLRNYPSGTYTMLCEKRCKPLREGESVTFYCDDFVKIGTVSKYQALADYLKWIDESNEGNNEKTTSANW